MRVVGPSSRSEPLDCDRRFGPRGQEQHRRPPNAGSLRAHRPQRRPFAEGCGDGDEVVAQSGGRWASSPRRERRRQVGGRAEGHARALTRTSRRVRVLQARAIAANQRILQNVATEIDKRLLQASGAAVTPRCLAPHLVTADAHDVPGRPCARLHLAASVAGVDLARIVACDDSRCHQRRQPCRVYPRLQRFERWERVHGSAGKLKRRL
mmetsp:Transcript_34361/g.94675  ORF Transcript_34361/g.94675 Transcript_34361/m.94675 type:complete len:209 (+) Transcript_34361:442-1068(+)